MAQSPEELERLRNRGAAGFQAQQQPAPKPKKKPKPSPEMEGIDQAPRWNLEGESSQRASQQVFSNVDTRKAVSPEMVGTENLPRWSQMGDQGPRLSDQGFGVPGGDAPFAANPKSAPAPAKASNASAAVKTAQQPIPSPEMVGVEQIGRWPKPDDISLAMSLQTGPAIGSHDKTIPAEQQPAISTESSGGFKASIPGQILGAIKGDNPIPGTGGLYKAVNERGPKIAQSLSDGEYANAAGQLAGVPGDSFRYGLYGAMDTAAQTAEALPDVAAGFGKFMDGLAGRESKPAEQTAPEVRPPMKLEPKKGETAQTTAAESKGGDTSSDKSEGNGFASRTTTDIKDTPLENDIRMTINEDGNRSFSGRNAGAGATLNGKPFSNNVNVVPSEGMRQLAAAVNPPMAPRQQPQQQAPERGFLPQQSYRPAPKSDFEKQVEREIFRQATTSMRGAQNGQLTASQRGSLDKLAGNMSGERSGFDLQSMRNQGMLGNTAMMQAGQDRREGARLALDASRLAGDQYAQGFQIRQNERLESLKEAYTSAETPDQRSAIAEQLKVLNASSSDRKVQDNYVAVDQVFQDQYGNPTKARVAIDPATGQVLGGMQQEQALPQPTPGHIKALKSNPTMAAQFDEMYGHGAAARYGVNQ